MSRATKQPPLASLLRKRLALERERALDQTQRVSASPVQRQTVAIAAARGEEGLTQRFLRVQNDPYRSAVRRTLAIEAKIRSCRPKFAGEVVGVHSRSTACLRRLSNERERKSREKREQKLQRSGVFKCEIPAPDNATSLGRRRKKGRGREGGGWSHSHPASRFSLAASGRRGFSGCSRFSGSYGWLFSPGEL